MSCDPDSGIIRMLNEGEQPKGKESLFAFNEIITIKGCDFKVIQICGSPHNTITLQSVGRAQKLLSGMEPFDK